MLHCLLGVVGIKLQAHSSGAAEEAAGELWCADVDGTPAAARLLILLFIECVEETC